MSKAPRSKEKFREIHDRMADSLAALETVCAALEIAEEYQADPSGGGPDLWYVLRTARRTTG